MYEVISLKTVDSTSRFLKDYCQKNKPDDVIFCTTEKQTQGYGQQNRSWVTGENSAILSVAYPIKVKQFLTGVTSLQIAKLVHQTLAMLLDDKLYLKWPNDLFSERGKVAGVLVEQVLLKDYRCLVIGIGINRHGSGLPEDVGRVADFDLEEFMEIFHELVQQFGLVDFNCEQLFYYWQQNDFFKLGSEVCVLNESETSKKTGSLIKGIYKGLNNQGQAVLEYVDATNQLSTMLLSSGLSSIRKL